MEGELKPLATNTYNPSYDVTLLNTYDFDRLDTIKLEIESELHLLANKLEANGVSMDSSLITIDGFPRSDINVIDIRTARVKIIKLKNDLQAVINELAIQLSYRLQNPSASANMSATAGTSKIVDSMVAFAIISEVIPGGPGEKSGLQVLDKIVSFGNVNATNHNCLKSVAQLIKANEDKTILIGIIRDGSRMDVSLVPTSKWSGQGLLGCRLTQI